MRTTIDIDDPVLQDLKKLQKETGKPLKRIVSDLLGEALKRRRSAAKPGVSCRWVAKEMGARVDLNDRDAIYDAMEDRTR